jgi:NADH-quinone oxidoreductase subunit K
MMLPTNGYVLLSAFLFATGLFGVLARRTPLTLFMSVELMFNAANLALIAYARRWGNLDGQIVALFVITVAAAEVVVGLALIVRLGPQHQPEPRAPRQRRRARPPSSRRSASARTVGRDEPPLSCSPGSPLDQYSDTLVRNRYCD